MVPPGNDDNFNFEQSSLRINIECNITKECSFWELARRWGILWTPLYMSSSKRTSVIGLAVASDYKTSVLIRELD